MSLRPSSRLCAHAVLALGLLFIYACSSDGNGGVFGECTPGTREPCLCDDLREGERFCEVGGTWSACECGAGAFDCGNGMLEPGEACDDGNEIDTDACRNNCLDARCGDGVVWEGQEVCDDGNEDNSDSCTNACLEAACGDGFVQEGEACDDGDGLDTNGCTTQCTLAECGDGFVQEGEQCDDGEGNDDEAADACRSSCLNPRCGDGVLDTGEECDEGLGNSDTSPDTCRNDCRLPFCGDGVVDAGEACDDANFDQGDSCPNTCEAARCGDGFLFAGVEDCDDGEGNDDTLADACRTSCENAGCGDGVLDTGEDCDDGNDAQTDACLNNCVPARCGDGFVQAEVEGCDDADDNSDSVVDACRTNCQSAHCGDGVVDSGETCDDADGDDSDECPGSCQAPRCGDGFVFPDNETCDDGELNSDREADACRLDCQPARCGDGVTDSDETCDDGNAIETDGCLSTCEGARCGDGVVQDAFEQCDNGQDNSDREADACRTNCERPRCGDGVTDTGEECDDGELNSDQAPNACRSNCTRAAPLVLTQQEVHLSQDHFNFFHDRYSGDGYFLVTYATLVEGDGTLRISASWQRNRALLAAEIDADLLSADLDQAIIDRRVAGWRMNDIDVYLRDGVPRYSAVWVRDRGGSPSWALERDHTRPSMQSVIVTQAGAGRRPYRMASYFLNDVSNYVMLFIEDGIETWVELGVTAAGYDEAIANQRELNRFPVEIEVLHTGAEPAYSGIWILDDSNSGWALWHDRDLDFIRGKAQEQRGFNMVPTDFEGYYTDAASTELTYALSVRRPHNKDQLRGNLNLSSAQATQLSELVSSFPGNIGVYVEDLTNGRFIAANEHEPFYLAQTAGLPVAEFVARMQQDAGIGFNAVAEMRAEDFRHARDVLGMDRVGTDVPLWQWFRHMLADGSSAAFDRMLGFGGASALNTWHRVHAGRQNLARLESECQFTRRVAAELHFCAEVVPCEIIVPFWRDGVVDPGHGPCLDLLVSTDSQVLNQIHTAAFSRMDGSASPAEYGRFLRGLVGLQHLDETFREQVMARVADAQLDYVDTHTAGANLYDGLAGVHGTARRSRSWVGTAWRDGAMPGIADANYEYVIAIFTEDWDNVDQDNFVRDQIARALQLSLSLLRDAR